MKLLFVYNADSGLAAALFDSAHKALSPSTYQCNLCALTHGMTGAKKEWNTFLKTLPEKPVFLHRDEFLKQYSDHAETPLPAIFRMNEDGTGLKPVTTGPGLQRLKSLDELTRLLRA